jgi:hypothetical protein
MNDITNLPDPVIAAMREMLAEYRALAATRDSPGDGSMITIDPDKLIDGGNWKGGWTLQVTLVEDERRFDEPGAHLVVHAYSDCSALSKGSMSRPMTWTKKERRALVTRQLEHLRARRDEINTTISELEAELRGDV